MIEILACSLLMRVKGGGHGFIRNKVKNRILHRILDGKILSSLGFGCLCLTCGFPPAQAGLMALGWCGGIAPSIGEDIQAIREGNWKPGLQRGVFMGACLTLASWNPIFILAGALFPLAYWLSLKIDPLDWWSGELIYGAMIGAALAYG